LKFKQTRRHRKQQVIEHVAIIGKQALAISVDLYRQEGAVPTPEHLLVFIIAVMVSLEMDEDLDDVLNFSLKRGEQFLAMSTMFWLLFDLGELTLPDGFPYTLAEMKAISLPPKGAN
jgi:hypothetical protein